jgi:signal transduction histidine kinase
MGYAGQLDAENGDAARILKAHARDIADLGEKAREIITIFDQGQARAQPTPLSDLLDAAVASVREDHPDVAVEMEPVDAEWRVAALLKPVFANVVENAAEHNPSADATVTVSVDAGDDTVTVRVADDGPGMNESEFAVIAEGTETPLEHASGLGLWLIHWGTEIAGGTVRFEENEPTGTVVSVDVPRLDEATNDRPDYQS